MAPKARYFLVVNEYVDVSFDKNSEVLVVNHGVLNASCLRLGQNNGHTYKI